MSAALGTAWPEQVGLTARANFRLLCTAPAQWLAIGSASALHGVHALPSTETALLTWVEVSDALGVLTLSGKWVTDLLASACALDTHLSVFPVDRCRCTRFAGLAAIIERRAIDMFDCYVPASYSSYTQTYLRDAASNLGVSLE
jgi:heterotetrameric sarcosine oxidase gamma subunit